MFDVSAFENLSADDLCHEVQATQARLREQEWRELVLAVSWADVHSPVPPTPAEAVRRVVYGERMVPAGGDGTPLISEFACAELGLVMGTGFISAGILIRDAVNLRHRHPEAWALLRNGRGRVYKARHVARMCHSADLTREQAQAVDSATTPFLDSLAWSAFTRLVEARIIEADPAAAEARRLAAAMARFVTTGASDEHGLKTLIARAAAGDVVVFVAMCDRIAAILALGGDPDTADVRRSKAIGILANPAVALALLEAHATDEPHPDEPPSDEPHPDEPHPDEAHTDVSHRDDSGQGPTPDHRCTACGGPRIDADQLRPRAVLHVRISEAALHSDSTCPCSGATPVADVDHGVGPVPVQALHDLLGHHRVTVRPVLDVDGQVPVDAYEVPAAMREALHLTRLSSVFPWSRTIRPDDDHTRPYVSPARGGPPGQTTLANLGPLGRLPHRVKTHSRGWVMRQPTPGTYLWRTPHDYWFRVDRDGTHPLGRDPDLSNYDPSSYDPSGYDLSGCDPFTSVGGGQLTAPLTPA